MILQACELRPSEKQIQPAGGPSVLTRTPFPLSIFGEHAQGHGATLGELDKKSHNLVPDVLAAQSQASHWLVLQWLCHEMEGGLCDLRSPLVQNLCFCFHDFRAPLAYCVLLGTPSSAHLFCVERLSLPAPEVSCQDPVS